MRFACGDMRDHIVSYQNDHRPSYWRRRALRQQARLRIDFSEILRVVRFSTFATISANSGLMRANSIAYGGDEELDKPREDRSTLPIENQSFVSSGKGRYCCKSRKSYD